MSSLLQLFDEKTRDRKGIDRPIKKTASDTGDKRQLLRTHGRGKQPTRTDNAEIENREYEYS